MKILLITQWFYPETAPDIKGLQFARALKRRGYDVEVLTGFPNYPVGKVYPGYKLKIYQKEVIDGIVIHRILIFPSHDSSAVKRILNYLSYAVSASILGPFIVRNVDIAHVYAPETVIIPGLVFKILKKIPVIHDIQDLWPDSLSATGMISNPAILKLCKKFCMSFYKYYDRIIVLSEGFKSKLLAYGVSKEKIEVIYNWSNETNETVSAPSISEDIYGFNKAFTIVFAGNIGKAQSLESVLKAAKILEEKKENIQIFFFGGGIELGKLKSLAEEMILDNVFFYERVNAEKIYDILKSADALLVHLKKDPLFSITIPSKTQSYMRAGKPIIMAVEGDAAALVEKSGCGLFAEPENPSDIAEKMIMISKYSIEDLNMLGLNAKKFYEANLSIEVGMNKFESIISNLLRGGKPDGNKKSLQY